jgi:threonine synthase
MRNEGTVMDIPKLYGIQAKACPPYFLASTVGKNALNNIEEGQTLAEGVRIKFPHRLNEVLEIVSETGGGFIVVEEEDILVGQRALAEKGFFVEPTSAIVWNGLLQVIRDSPDPIVLILTGSGLKAA